MNVGMCWKTFVFIFEQCMAKKKNKKKNNKQINRYIRMDKQIYHLNDYNLSSYRYVSFLLYI